MFNPINDFRDFSWVEKVINSCDKTIQLFPCYRLVDNYYNLYGNNFSYEILLDRIIAKENGLMMNK